jgi:ATP:corrinoid adenosyltransferase
LYKNATGYHCAGHGDFKVADTVAADAKAKANDSTREQWEAALEKAQERTEDDEWPLIVTDDFS